ncbi:hypothetical protein BDV96DRAFT_636539 [Lophiotrema nucula]|uniref:Secreted protein n=1 Tax=Lophiotrema nucula TaxID=690887 RepID=A0A6A5YPC4_9PLEO|nr:hypothetical protein BDV96DRAFT_636539 [Lophiotrema nucula]
MLFGTSPVLLAILYAGLLPIPTNAQPKGFENPTPEFRPKFRYWLPDASVSSAIVADDFEDAKDAGAGGLELLPFYLYGMGYTKYSGLPDWSKYGFGTPAFVSLFKDALKAAEKNGILMDFALGANQGQGIPAEVSTPGLAVELLMGNTTITPKGSFSAPVPQARQPSASILSGLNFMHPLEQFGTPNLTAVIAYQVLSEGASSAATAGSKPIFLNQSSYIDLMPLVKDGWSLQWTPPDTTKTWKMFSFWEAYTNQRSCDGGPNATTWIGNGSWTVDHFSKTGAAKVTEFWDTFIRSDQDVAKLLSSVGKYAWEDSMEMLSALYWTPGLSNRFNATHGYDLTPYLPLLFSSSNTWNGALPVYGEVYGFNNDSTIGNSIYQLDYRDVLNDGYRDYLSHFANWSHSIGAEYSAQPAYNLPLQMLSDIPLLDAPEGESLGFSRLTDAYRQFAGPAHLTNKKVISTELGAVNIPPYSLHIPDLLQQIKRSLAGGFTMHVLHGFPYSGPYSNTTWPGYTTFFYEFTDMWNKIQPAWQHMKDYLDYVGRNQWALQQGSPKVDLAFYLFASPWSPKTQYNSTNLQNIGFTYDYLGPDNLASSDAFVKDGTLGVPSYKVLIFNNQTVITVKAAEALVNKASAGLPIIFIGSAPSQTYPATASTQSSLASAVSKLLASPMVHQVKTINDVPMLLSKMSIKPHISLDCSSNPVLPVHRSAGDVDYIYLFNDQAVSAKCNASISASGVTPYIYNSWTGSQTPLLQYSTSNSTINIPIALRSNETTIIALHHNTTSPRCTFTATSGSLHSFDTANNGTVALVTGPAALTSSTGRISQLTPTVIGVQNLTTWDIVIEDWHSSDNRLLVQTEIIDHRFIDTTTLVPWTQLVSAIDGSSLERVSGVGHYLTDITVPTAVSNSSNPVFGILSLPMIQHTARVYIDGNVQAPIDPVRPEILLEGLVPGTTYQLRVEITTTLFNRIKAEANLTWIVGQVAGQLQPAYATLPYEKYGLLDPVTITWGEKMAVSC